MKTLLFGLAAGLVLVMVGGSAGAADKLDRSQKPTPGAAPPVVTPKIERATLSNGLAVWLVQRHELPVVNATLQVRSSLLA